MNTLTVRLSRPHPAQQQVIREARRFNVVCCGRRWGKTTLGIDRIIGPALEGYSVGWFSPTYKYLIEAWRAIRRILLPVSVRVSEQEHRIELRTGGVLEMWSLDNPDAGRSRAYRRVVVDEAALVRNLDVAWQEAIRPSLSDYAGDAWFMSTPKGMGFFYELWQRGQSDAHPDWASWQMPTSTNLYIPAQEIEAARAELPELVFAQEYLAQFIPDNAGVFRRVREAATAEPQEYPLPGHVYLVSVDWGKHEDFTVIAVWDVTLGHLVYLDRFNQVDYALQLSRLRAVCERFRPLALVPERNSMGEPLIELVARSPWAPPQIVPFTTTNASKALAVEAFALALEQGRVKILPDPVLIAELQAYQAERLPSGMLRYRAPEGMHDDCVMAAIIGWYAMTERPEREIVIYDDPVTISPV